jgi:DNA-binding transcriptional LysR family regulator
MHDLSPEFNMTAPKPGADIQLPHLETFSKAAEHCSFTAAGQELGLSQAAVSQRIHALEKILGKPLFERKGTRILVTETGQQLYEYTERILTLHREAFESLTGRRTPIRGELLLAASSIPGEHLLPEALAAFGKLHPGIRVRADVLDSLAVLHEVEQGNVHLGLAGRKVDSPHFEFQPFASDDLVVIVPADHPWRRRRSISPEQFLRQPLIVREAGSGSRWRLEQALSGMGKTLGDLEITLELGSNEAINKAVQKGMGVAVLSSLAVQKEVANGRIHSLKIAGLPLERTMYVVWDRRRVLPAPARVFRHFIQTAEAGAPSS